MKRGSSIFSSDVFNYNLYNTTFPIFIEGPNSPETTNGSTIKEKDIAEPSFEAGYGDIIGIEELDRETSYLFPNHFVSDIALNIITKLDVKTLGKFGQISKSWNKISNHFFALEKIKLYEKISNPENWNEWHSGFQITYNERKNAFRTLPLNIVIDTYAVAYKPANLTLNKMVSALKIKRLIWSIPETIIKKYGDEVYSESSWVMSKRNSSFNRRTSETHEFPKVLEMIVLLAGEKIKFDHQLFDGGYTCCQETCGNDGSNNHLFVALTIKPTGIIVLDKSNSWPLVM